MAEENPFAAVGVRRVINAAGKMTALGGSAQAEVVASAQAAAARAHVDLETLRRVAGARIAERCGAEAACITTGAAAGICISVAAVLTGTDADRVQRVPDRLDGPREVILQSGQDVFFGATVEQMIRLGGGIPIVAGSHERVSDADVRARLGAATACLLYVKSHHCIQERRVDFDAYVALAHGAGLPLIVDAAAEADLEGYLAAGADLVTYSGGKAISGPTSGFIAGRRALVAACELQNAGIARPMKVGKEQIMGLLAALERYPPPDTWRQVLDALMAALAPLPHLVTSRVPDRTGRDIERLGVQAADGAFAAVDLVRWLEDGTPSIRTRNHQLKEGLVLFDTREMELEHVDVIRDRVAAFLRQLAT
jgi:L-seryl-tRNA(Ser) seleniumtransferase/D-glucosaminate-6-phosphate ammonia-lyase